MRFMHAFPFFKRDPSFYTVMIITSSAYDIKLSNGYFMILSLQILLHIHAQGAVNMHTIDTR